MNHIQTSNMQTQFTTECRTLLNSLPSCVGDMARLGHRLSQAIDIIEAQAEELHNIELDLREYNSTIDKRPAL